MTRKEIYDTMVSEVVARLADQGGELRSRQVDAVLVEVAGLAADFYERLDHVEQRLRLLERA